MNIEVELDRKTDEEISFLWKRGSHSEKAAFKTRGWKLHHHLFWDGLYVMWRALWLNRHFKSGEDVVVKVDFPIHPLLKEMFEKLAPYRGASGRILAEDLDDVGNIQLEEGVAVAYGAGKDSNLIAGMLEEIGQPFELIYTWLMPSAPRPDERVKLKMADSRTFDLTSCIMPAMLSGRREVYIGAGLGEQHWVIPWHSYYTYSGPMPINMLQRVLDELGIDRRILVPLGAVPYNQTQRILGERYGKQGQWLEKQRSVSPRMMKSEKALQVALLKMYHSQPTGDLCGGDAKTFRGIAKTWVLRQGRSPWMKHRSREVIQKEMRAILWELRCHSWIEGLQIPEEWRADWINRKHSYVENPSSPEMDRILAEYMEEQVEQVIPTAKNRKPFVG